MTLPRHRPVPQIRARTTPSHDAHKPFVFTTSGSVKGPNWIPSMYDCRGDVTVHFLLGGRRIGATLLPVQPNCSSPARPSSTTSRTTVTCRGRSR